MKGVMSFVCLPTGYGKSLCYQSLPFVMEQELGGDRAVFIVYALVAILSSSTSVSKDKLVQEVPLQRLLLEAIYSSFKNIPESP